jgi:branched-chain amino acid aminotransferase
VQRRLIIYQWTDPVFRPWQGAGRPVNSLNEAQAWLPDGVYTTFRTYRRNQVVRLAAHFQRLEDSARLLGYALQLDRDSLRSGLAGLVEEVGYAETRVRMSVDLSERPGALYAFCEPLTTPSPEEYAQGVSVVTRQAQREQPKAKSTRFIQRAAEIRQETNGHSNEVVMVSTDRRFLEGLSSNFFAISGAPSGTVWTEEQGVLSGVTRSLVLDVLQREGLPVRLEGFSLDGREQLQEAFLTSASRGVLPVCQIDWQPVGAGIPGPITLRIRAGFERLLGELLEPIATR